MTHVDRRAFLWGASAAVAIAGAPHIAFAQGAGNKRLVFIIQRGAADGLAILAPVGDPAYAGLRGALAHDALAAPRLDSFFALHPAFEAGRQLYASGEMTFIHAVATAYRERSHFEGQNLLEIGAGRPYARPDGWLNRLLTMMPGSGAKGLAISATLPPALRGDAPASSYAPSNLPEAQADLVERLSGLYAGDPLLHRLWEEARATRGLVDAMAVEGGRGGAATGQLAASLLAAPDGPRIAMIETDGWDTHTGQPGRITAQMRDLSAMITALKSGLGPAWADTLLVVATEFGRTAAVNGTNGTDHGTGSLMMLAGGGVRGGRIIADWPGLAQNQLYQARDLKPTISLEAVMAGAMADHFGLDARLAAATLFPDAAPSPVRDLIRSS